MHTSDTGTEQKDLESLAAVGQPRRRAHPRFSAGPSSSVSQAPLMAGQGGQLMWALTAVATPAVTWAVATPGWQPGRLAVMV